MRLTFLTSIKGVMVPGIHHPLLLPLHLFFHPFFALCSGSVGQIAFNDVAASLGIDRVLIRCRVR